jgi:hypothetical protein
LSLFFWVLQKCHSQPELSLYFNDLAARRAADFTFNINGLGRIPPNGYDATQPNQWRGYGSQ